MKRTTRVGLAGTLASAFVAVNAAPAAADGFSNAYNWGCPVSNPGCSHAAPHNLSTSAGISGRVVAMWQSILYENGLYACSSIDGSFGTVTRDATKKYQHLFSEGDTSLEDGIVGSITWGWVQDPDESWEVGGPLGGNYYEYFYAPKSSAPSGEMQLIKNGNSGGSWKWSAPFVASGTGQNTNHGSGSPSLSCP